MLPEIETIREYVSVVILRNESFYARSLASNGTRSSPEIVVET